MGAAIFAQNAGIDQIMLKAGLGIAGLLIIVFSTVTTTYLDAYSAGVSSETIFSKINGKYMAIAVTIVGTIAAIIYPMDPKTIRSIIVLKIGEPAPCFVPLPTSSLSKIIAKIKTLKLQIL